MWCGGLQVWLKVDCRLWIVIGLFREDKGGRVHDMGFWFGLMDFGLVTCGG